MSNSLEMLGMIIYIIIFFSALIFIIFCNNKESRKLIALVSVLLFLIFLNMFLFNPIIQLILFFVTIFDLLYISFDVILPHFYIKKEFPLFMEPESEVWDDLKVNKSIIKE